LWYELEPVITDYFVFVFFLWILFLKFYIKIPDRNPDLVELEYNYGILSEITLRLKNDIKPFSCYDKEKINNIKERLNLLETLHNWWQKDNQEYIK